MHWHTGTRYEASLEGFVFFELRELITTNYTDCATLFKCGLPNMCKRTSTESLLSSCCCCCKLNPRRSSSLGSDRQIPAKALPPSSNGVWPPYFFKTLLNLHPLGSGAKPMNQQYVWYVRMCCILYTFDLTVYMHAPGILSYKDAYVRTVITVRSLQRKTQHTLRVASGACVIR